MVGRESQNGPRISLVVAMARNGVIGRDGQLPWRMPEDLKRFRALTMGHHIVMGRRTFESVGRLLPGRTSVIVTRNLGFRVPGAIVAHTLQEALAACAGDEEIFVIGGAEIYRAALPLADRLYLTRVEADIEGDTVFPAWDESEWVLRSREPLTPEPASGAAVEYRVYERRRGASSVGD
jgi:dihydrofolate reductase